jgi:hypothetical protein
VEKVASLRKRCYDLGLDTSGGRLELKSRLDLSGEVARTSEVQFSSHPSHDQGSSFSIPLDVIAMILARAAHSDKANVRSYLLVSKKLHLKLVGLRMFWQGLLDESMEIGDQEAEFYEPMLQS